MPVEIKQLVIKSKTIGDDVKYEHPDSDMASPESVSQQSEKGSSFHLIASPGETRER